MALGLNLDKPLPGDTTPLCTAVCLGDWVATQCLIFSGVDVDKPFLRYVDPNGEPDDQIRDNTFQPPIVQAIGMHMCYSGVSLADLLITNGANVDCLVREHKNALLLALKSEKYEVAETLLEHGENPNTMDLGTGMDAFDYIFKSHLWPPYSTFKSLIDHGFHVKAEVNAGALVRVVARASKRVTSDYDRWDDFAPVIFLLLDAGTELNARPTKKYSMTALQYAVDANHTELITILLAAGADIHAPAFRKQGKTSLQAACCAGNLELVREFVAQDLDINAQPASHYGATALQFAAMRGHSK